LLFGGGGRGWNDGGRPNHGEGEADRRRAIIAASRWGEKKRERGGGGEVLQRPPIHQRKGKKKFSIFSFLSTSGERGERRSSGPVVPQTGRVKTACIEIGKGKKKNSCKPGPFGARGKGHVSIEFKKKVRGGWRKEKCPRILTH